MGSRDAECSYIFIVENTVYGISYKTLTFQISKSVQILRLHKVSSRLYEISIELCIPQLCTHTEDFQIFATHL